MSSDNSKERIISIVAVNNCLVSFFMWHSLKASIKELRKPWDWDILFLNKGSTILAGLCLYPAPSSIFVSAYGTCKQIQHFAVILFEKHCALISHFSLLWQSSHELDCKAFYAKCLTFSDSDLHCHRSFILLKCLHFA